MKGRSHRPLPSAPLEDWGDGQWTVDCSCGVNFDDGEEMVSCDECGVWVHTRCSRYVRGEVSFACHKCKLAAKCSRSVMAPAASDFIHDTEETEVAQLLVELPTKADHPPPISSVGASYRPPLRLWAHVPMEERVHVQGVPGGDPSLFRGLSSTIFSPELWKCTGYVPKKFNFKYKEFPCWEEEERDKASRGADALFSLSKEIVQDTPARTLEKILSPNGSRKKCVDKFLLGTRPFGCVKKERNKLRVLGSHSSKRRKEELGEEKESSGRKRPRGDLYRALADVKEKAGSVPMFDSLKEDLEDDSLQIEESDFHDSRSAYNKEDVILKSSGKVSNEGMDNNSKSKHLLVFKTCRKRLSDEALSSKLPLKTPVKVEKVDGLDGRVSCKLDTDATCHVESRNITKVFNKQEDISSKVPKDGSCVATAGHGGSIVVNGSEKMNGGIYSNGNLSDVADIISSSSIKKAELNVKVEAIGDQASENSYIPLFSGGDLQATNNFSPKQVKLMDSSSTVQEESVAVMCMQPEEQKTTVMQKDLELSQSNIECINTAGSESLLNEVVDSAVFLKRCKDSVELNDSNPIHSFPPVQQMVGTGKENFNSTAPFGSKSSVSSTQNSAAICGSKSLVSSTQNLTASAVSSSPVKTINVAKPQRVKVSSETTDNMLTSITEENEHGVLQHPGKVHPAVTESVGTKSFQAGKNSRLSSSKNCSLDKKEQQSGLPQTLSEDPATSLETAEASRSLLQTPANLLRTTSSLGSSQKNDKTMQSNAQLASKFFGHSVIQASISSNAAASTLSDEELALLLHQELNSSPRVPRVPRMRQATNTQFATPNASSMLSKRAFSGKKDQVSCSRRKHKRDASKDGSRHPRDAISESRRSCRHSPEGKLDELAISGDSFTKKGKGSRSYDTAASSKASVLGPSVEGASSMAISSEENGTRTSLRSSSTSVNEDGTLIGLSLPGLIDEIMSKRKCSTYEELCDSVRPYWRSLRKPNGERYAYFSHSQAVLDCLRNRGEWAHLIDRGPKTNASKRRRKLDAETPAMDLDYEKSGNSHKEDFPKGKRNVRKPRLPELRPGNVKEATNASTPSDDEQPALSHSSNERASDDTGPEACSSSSGDSD